jgi:hypothetical protein
MTIPSGTAVSFSDIASEYGMANSNLSLRRLANIGSVYFPNMDSFRGKNYYDFIGTAADIILTGTQQDTALGYFNNNTVTTRAMVGLTSTTKNVIYEGGGGGSGGALYGFGGSIYHQAGTGGSIGGSGETSASIPGGWSSSDTREIINAFDGTQNSIIWLDGEQQSTSTGIATTRLGGNNSSGSGQVYGQICTTRMTDDNPKAFANGDLRFVHIWETAVPNDARLYGVQQDLPASYSSKTSLEGATQATIRTAVLLDSSETGFLYQAGGTGRGLVLYVWDGKIYAQAGDGSTSGGDIEISYTIPASITTSDVTMIVYSVNITTGSSANLYVNGQLVATASGTTNVDVSGNSEGGSGTSYGATPVTRVTSGSETYTGTIYETLTWKNVFV